MSLALEWAPDITSKEKFDRWAFNHWQDHVSIVNAIKAQKGLQLQMFPIYPVVPGSEYDWLLMHQELHFAFDGILSIPSYNLVTVSPFDAKQRSQFLYFNFMEHLAAAKALGIG